MLIVSVVLCTHRRPATLRRSLASLLRLGDDFQAVLCCDEGSAATRSIAAEMLRPTDIFLSVPGIWGPSASRNLGIQIAQGEYVGFLDDDDTLDPSYATLLEHFDGESVIYTNYRKIFERDEGEHLVETRRAEKSNAGKKPGDVLIRNHINISGFLAPANAIRPLRFRSDLSVSEDWEFILQLKAAARFRHADLFASNWHHLDDQQTRDNVSKAERAKAYAAICSLHPSDEAAVIKGRSERMKKLGRHHE
jgi:glycosyltransferase involved in cell wall biosynthesis